MNPNKPPQIDLRANPNDINTWNDVHARMARRQAYAKAFVTGMLCFLIVATVTVLAWLSMTYGIADYIARAGVVGLCLWGGVVIVRYVAKVIHSVLTLK